MPEWTTLHDVSFLYLFLAENLDHNLSTPERNLIVRRIARWAPGESATYLTRVLRETHDAVNSGSPDRMVTHVIDSLKSAPLSDRQRSEILNDLRQIARVDGQLISDEVDFLRDLQNAWSVAPDERASGTRNTSAVTDTY